MARKKRKTTNKIFGRRARKPKPMKIAALIVSAIQDLRETKGSTPNKIIGYISYASNMPEGRVKRQVKAALKKGVEYGILKRHRGHYFLPTGDELDRANRIAVRFAKLPAPISQSVKSNGIRTRKRISLRDRKKPMGLGFKGRRTKRLTKTRFALLSPTTSLTEKLSNHELCAVD